MIGNLSHCVGSADLELNVQEQLTGVATLRGMPSYILVAQVTKNLTLSRHSPHTRNSSRSSSCLATVAA
jgi:hypothetical protein